VFLGQKQNLLVEEAPVARIFAYCDDTDNDTRSRGEIRCLLSSSTACEGEVGGWHLLGELVSQELRASLLRLERWSAEVGQHSQSENRLE